MMVPFIVILPGLLGFCNFFNACPESMAVTV